VVSLVSFFVVSLVSFFVVSLVSFLPGAEVRPNSSKLKNLDGIAEPRYHDFVRNSDEAENRRIPI